MIGKIKKAPKIISEILKLSSRVIFIDTTNSAGKRIYVDFNKRHSKLPLVKKKTIGVALIELKNFKNAGEYIQTVNGKNSAAYFSRKAGREGYTFGKIDPNRLVDDIFEINTSAGQRQGSAMGESYRKKIDHYPVDENNFYFGVFKDEKLFAYLWCVASGELVLFNRLLGHAAHLKNGIMYLLLTSAISELIDNRKNIRFAMYDTLFGASEGLRLFKERIGFRPYRVKWINSKSS